MYLSKLQLDIANPSVRQALRDCQDMHRNIMKAFDQSRETVQMLYRLVERIDCILLYVFSSVQPYWDHVIKNGYVLQDMKDISSLNTLYGNGSVLHFDLLACPSKKVSANGKKNSSRVMLKTAEERDAWLKRQAAKYGFEVLQCVQPTVDKQISGKRGDNAVLFTAVEFEGVLRITDAELFWKSYAKGIGPEKAYGTGLLMLSRG